MGTNLSLKNAYLGMLSPAPGIYDLILSTPHQRALDLAIQRERITVY
jgi:hypothetical protein